MGRICAQCRRDLPSTSYTGNQYSKGAGLSRCVGCVHGAPHDIESTKHIDSGRYSKSTSASFYICDMENPFAQGAFRWVALGHYTEGERKGEACVLKWFKTGAVFTDEYFRLDIKAVHKALEIVDRFNQMRILTKKVKINVATVWLISSGSRKGQRILVEPYIENYQKFNSNTGWNDSSIGWPAAMQALSHFSYHITGGMFVLCDLQGGVYEDGVVLSDPVILSRKREYGVTDLGPDGISSFFSQHKCNRYCRANWSSPANPRQIFEPVEGSSMMSAEMYRPVRVAQPRPLMTYIEEGEEEEDDYYYY